MCRPGAAPSCSPWNRPADARATYPLVQEKHGTQRARYCPCFQHPLVGEGDWDVSPANMGQPLYILLPKKVQMREKYSEKYFCLWSVFPWKLKNISVLFFQEEKKNLSLPLNDFLSLSVSLSLCLSLSLSNTHTKYTRTHTQAEISLHWI